VFTFVKTGENKKSGFLQVCKSFQVSVRTHAADIKVESEPTTLQLPALETFLILSESKI